VSSSADHTKFSSIATCECRVICRRMAKSRWRHALKRWHENHETSAHTLLRTSVEATARSHQKEGKVACAGGRNHRECKDQGTSNRNEPAYS